MEEEEEVNYKTFIKCIRNHFSISYLIYILLSKCLSVIIRM